MKKNSDVRNRGLQKTRPIRTHSAVFERLCRNKQKEIKNITVRHVGVVNYYGVQVGCYF
jgi:hypothetical protein